MNVKIGVRALGGGVGETPLLCESSYSINSKVGQ